MPNLQESTLKLILDYISCAEYMCNCLKDEYPVAESLLRARRANVIPKSGVLSNGIYFNFHGGGCYFEFENGSIDVDFGPNDRCDGFDYYRLKEFLSYKAKDKYIELHGGERLMQGFQKLLLEDAISSPKWDLNSHLYYLKERQIK